MDGKEVELKLALAPEGLERLRREPRIRAARQGRAATRRLVSTYYDTDDFTLARAGISLRVRMAGRQRVQTVKTAGSRNSGLFARQEWEAPVETAGPDPVLLHATGLPALQDPALLARLTPIFTTRVTRTAYRLSAPEWEVELALDRGEVEAGPAREEISEAEFELLRGEPAHLFDLARDISRSLPTRLLALSKSDRGYALATGRRAGPVKARPVALEADMPVAEAFGRIAANCLHHLLANEHSLVAGRDPEAVHQMRVALRRLRSALKLFRKLVEGPGLDRVRDEIRWLLDHLGPARDAHVFATEILAPVEAAHPGIEALAMLRDHWHQAGERHFAAAHAAVQERRFTLMLLDLGAWIEAGDWRVEPAPAAPLGPFARKALDKARDKLLRHGGKSLAQLPPDALHEVRILGKRLRYAGEFFTPLFDKAAAKDYLAELAALQDVLGELNDIAVAGPRLARHHHDPDLAWAAGLVAGWQEARRGDLLAAAEKAWKRFRRKDPFWD